MCGTIIISRQNWSMPDEMSAHYLAKTGEQRYSFIGLRGSEEKTHCSVSRYDHAAELSTYGLGIFHQNSVLLMLFLDLLSFKVSTYKVLQSQNIASQMLQA